MMQLAKSSATVRSARYQASKVAKPVSAARYAIVPRASPSPPENTNAGPASPPGTIFYGELVSATHARAGRVFVRFTRRTPASHAIS